MKLDYIEQGLHKQRFLWVWCEEVNSRDHGRILLGVVGHILIILRKKKFTD